MAIKRFAKSDDKFEVWLNENTLYTRTETQIEAKIFVNDLKRKGNENAFFKPIEVTASNVKQFTKTSGVFDFLKSKPQTPTTTGDERNKYLAQKLDEILAKTPVKEKAKAIDEFFNGYLQLSESDKQKIVGLLKFYKSVQQKTVAPKKSTTEPKWID